MVKQEFVKNVEAENEADAVDKVNTSNNIQQQLSIDTNIPTCSKQMEISEFYVDNLHAEPLEVILNNKAVRERQIELERKLDIIRKKHDKEKLKIMTLKSSSSQEKKKKFGLTNKLVKRLSNKTM